MAHGVDLFSRRGVSFDATQQEVSGTILYGGHQSDIVQGSRCRLDSAWSVTK